jgi:hypothetical protein
VVEESLQAVAGGEIVQQVLDRDASAHFRSKPYNPWYAQPGRLLTQILLRLVTWSSALFSV